MSRIQELISSLSYVHKEAVDLQGNNCIGNVGTLKPGVDLYPPHAVAGQVPKPVPQLKISGTIPINYKYSHYNIPIAFYLDYSFPSVAPNAFIVPTPTMVLAHGHKHVDQTGRIHLQYLHDWDHSSSLAIMIAQMCEVFSQHPPVYSKPAEAAQSLDNSGAAPMSPDLYARTEDKSGIQFGETHSTIKNISNNGVYTMSRQIFSSGVHSYSVKIDKVSCEGSSYIGLVDADYTTGEIKKFKACYLWGDGEVYTRSIPSNNEKSTIFGFHTGDEITVRVNFDDASIQFFLNGEENGNAFYMVLPPTIKLVVLLGTPDDQYTLLGTDVSQITRENHELKRKLEVLEQDLFSLQIQHSSLQSEYETLKEVGSDYLTIMDAHLPSTSTSDLLRITEKLGEKLAQARNEIDRRHREEKICQICADKPKCLALFCGHQFCEDCVLRFERCPMCRTMVTGSVRLLVE